MVGTALDKPSLTKIVRRLEAVEQPWNCPHGRPTMRHLADLTDKLTAAVSADYL
jgi:DNA mismatch repair protein PMS2